MRRAGWVRLLLFTILLCSPAVAAPVVAVMPFRDLSASAGKSPVGEAIRETVTADLKEISELKVVERSAIDKVLSEQNLQANRSDLDAPSTVKIGKLLGASLITTGAYQRSGSAIRLTARFVKVETGEVVGTAKVDGPASEFLQLQDRVTVELLRSAGMARQSDRFVRRARPKLKSLRAVELYGDAINESNDQKRVELLKQAVSEEPTFVYASRDLDALEKRLRALTSVQQVASGRKLEELRKQLAAETDPQKRKTLEGQLAGELMAARRWHELRRLARGTQLGTDGASFYAVQADALLHDWDAVLRDGEAFLQRYPGSPFFNGVKSQVEAAIARKRRAAEQRAGINEALKKIEGDQRYDLCRFGWVYRSHEMHEEARRFLRACLAVGTGGAKDLWPALVIADVELGDFAQARKDLVELRKVDGGMAATYETMVAIDD